MRSSLPSFVNCLSFVFLSIGAAGGVGCGAAPDGARVAARAVGAAPAPVLYQDPLHESPVRADPGDVLLVPGTGFTPQSLVVYQAVADTTAALAPPAILPTGAGADSGVVTPFARDENALDIVFPPAARAGQAYVLWAANPLGGGAAAGSARPSSA
jgi:hypothetical protein